MDMKEKKTGKGNNFPTNCREVQQMKDMEINEKIRYFRKQRGLSQELLAERIGINVNTIRKYEIGIRKPKVEQLKKIADGLEISVIEFLEQAATDPAAVERYENYLVTRRESYHRKKQEAERTA